MSSSFGKTLNVGFLLLTMALSSLVLGASAGAQEGQDNFTYTAESGDNLTLLVRSSVESLATNDEVELTDGQLISAETFVVQELGAYELNVGQEVVIERGLVQSGLNKATELSDTEEARWATYGPITRSSERPTAEATTTEDAEDEQSAEETEQAPAESTEETEEENTDESVTSEEEQTSEEPLAVETDDSQSVDAPATGAVLDEAIGTTSTDNAEASQTEDNNSDQAPWYWWVIGGSALGAMWYVLGGGPKQKETKPVKQNAKTKKKNKK